MSDDVPLPPPGPGQTDDPALTEKLRQLFRMCVGRPRGRQVIRGMVAPCDMTIGRHRMRLYPSENFTDFRLWLDGVAPEDASIAQLEARVAEAPSLILDIGANSGSFTLRLADAAAPGSLVRAFEPNPVMHARLCHNLDSNTLANPVEPHQCALGEAEGTAELSLIPGNYGQATLHRAKRARSTVTVPVRPLAPFFADAARYARIVVKIDIEGFEDVVLAGLFDAVPADAWPHDIMIETAHKRQWRTDLIALFQAKGYGAVFEGDGNTLYTRV